jgi:hypothetical protein
MGQHEAEQSTAGDRSTRGEGIPVKVTVRRHGNRWNQYTNTILLFMYMVVKSDINPHSDTYKLFDLCPFLRFFFFLGSHHCHCFALVLINRQYIVISLNEY